MADKSEGMYKPSREASRIRTEILSRKIDDCKGITPEQMDTIIDLHKTLNNKSEGKKLKSFFDETEGIKPLATYRCVSCDYKEKIFGKKEDYKELMICPKCNSALVDECKMMKYKKFSGMKLLSAEEHYMTEPPKDLTENMIKQLKSLQREARKATAALKEKEQLDKKYLNSKLPIVRCLKCGSNDQWMCVKENDEYIECNNCGFRERQGDCSLFDR